MAALRLPELGRVVGGRDANGFVMHQRAARIASESDVREAERIHNNESRGEKHESQFHT